MPGQTVSIAEIEEGLAEIPLLDAHTHLLGDQLCARGLADVLLYHMVISELYAAGCPNGARLTEFPGYPTQDEAHARIQQALPYLSLIRNTGMMWILRRILADLYGWDDPITEQNWRELDEQISRKAGDKQWPREVLDRAKIQRSVSELARRGTGASDDRLQYSLEWGFFTRCQWGEYDTALYELERCWGKEPESPLPVSGGVRPAAERVIETLDDVRDAVNHYVSHIPYSQVVSMATHISTDIDYRMVSDSTMRSALARRSQAGEIERDIYASYVNELFLTALETHAEEIVFQFSLAAEPLPHETASRISQRTIGHLADMIARHPGLRFQCLISSRHANQSLCTLARELPNLSLAGYWWHNFFPEAIQQVMGERLDMLPVNRQVGFFSDAYFVEWSYGKAFLVRKMFAQALKSRIDRGQYSLVDGLSIARSIFFETPQTLLNIQPKAEGA